MEDGLSDLLNRVTADPPDVLQLYVESAQPSFAPLRDEAILRGMRDFLVTCGEARIQVIAGRRYSSGLVLGAFGALGWTTGVSSVQQNFERHPDEPDDGGGGQAHPWIYVPDLLNSITLATRSLLLARGGLAEEVLAPSTAYAAELFANDERRTDLDTGGRILLRQHNLHALRQQASVLNGQPATDRRRTVRQWVDRAITLYNDLGGPWNESESPTFLTAWRNVL